MKVGICSGIENIKKVGDMGFDYIELTVVSVANMTEKEFAETVDIMEQSTIKCEAFNVFFPNDIRLVGPEVDKSKIKKYLEKAIERVSRLGGRVIVFGSGGARKNPEGWEFKKAWGQLLEIARLAGDMANRYEVTIVMEPLNTGETNILNSVEEGYRFVQEVNHSNVKLLADFYHMRKEDESMEEILTAGEVLRHLHIARGKGRTYPLNKKEDIYETFFEKLKQIRYKGRISIEGKTEDFEKDGPAALAFLRQLD